MRGKFSDHQTVRSILPSLPKAVNSDNARAGIGDDYGRLLLCNGGSVAAAAGVCRREGQLGFLMDFARLYNSIRVGGYKPCAMTDIIVMPEDGDERDMKRILAQLAAIGAEHGVDIIAGQTEKDSAVSEPVVSVTMLGRRLSDEVCEAADDRLCGTHSTRDASDAGDIVMSGHAGIAGMLTAYYEHKDGLYRRYSESYLRPVETLTDAVFLSDEPEIAAGFGLRYAHDVSHGGVYAALWELGEALQAGLSVCHDLIPIFQETVEVCEFAGINPYMADGCGAALFVAADGEGLAKALRRSDHEAEVIGRLTDGKLREITHDGESRYLEPFRMQKGIM